MVLYKNLLLGGKYTDKSKTYYSGIVFELTRNISNKYLFYFDDWEVEVSTPNIILARSEKIYPCNKIYELGYNACEKALDLINIKDDTAFLLKPYNQYVQLFYENKNYSLIIHDKEALQFKISAHLSVIDKDGNTVTQNTPKQILWNKIFRFYRFYKGSQNVYDSYRWMYLIFEMLMQKIYIKNEKESESHWIRRSLEEYDKKYQWEKSFNWSTKGNIDYFINKQYRGIRCKLFHAKDAFILPNKKVEQKRIQERLIELEDLCWFLFRKEFGISKSGGGFSDGGFKMMAQNFLTDAKAFIDCNEISCNPSETISLKDTAIIFGNNQNSIDIAKRNIMEICNTELDPKKEYYIKSYGMTENNEIVFWGNIKGFEMVLNEVSNICIKLQTHIANEGEFEKYIE